MIWLGVVAFFGLWLIVGLVMRRRGLSGTVAIGGGFIVAVLFFTLAALAVSKQEKAVAVPAPMTTGYKLAAIDADKVLSDNDPIVGKYEETLATLANLLQLPQDDVADMAAKTRQLAKERGATITTLEVIEAVQRISPQVSAPPGKEAFSQPASLYVTLRVQGMKHDEALRGLSGMIKTVNNWDSSTH